MNKITICSVIITNYIIIYIIAIATRLVSEFEHPGVLNLTHVAVDRGSIYLAGGNILYQLDQVAFKSDETSNMVLYLCKREL